MSERHHYGRPLEVKMEDRALVIRIGAQVLAHAVTYSDWANQYEEGESHSEYVRRFAITDVLEFAKDVIRAMLREAEDGSSPLSDFLDRMTEAAVDDGSMACEYDQRIAYNSTSPLETWATHPPPTPEDR